MTHRRSLVQADRDRHSASVEQLVQGLHLGRHFHGGGIERGSNTKACVRTYVKNSKHIGRAQDMCEDFVVVAVLTSTRRVQNVQILSPWSQDRFQKTGADQ